MPTDIDHVFPVKFEEQSSGGSQDDKNLTAMNPGEDALLAKAFLIPIDEDWRGTVRIQQGIKTDISTNDLLLFDRNVPSAGLPLFDVYTGYAGKYTDALATTTTTSTTYQQKVSSTFTLPRVGNYLLLVSFCFGTLSNAPCYVELQNDTAQVFEKLTTETTKNCMFVRRFNLTAGTHSFTLNYKSGQVNKEVYIESAVMALIRLEDNSEI